MRLPQKGPKDGTVYDYEEGVRIIRRAVELGVNYIDTAPYYCNQESEIIVGQAVKGIRDRVKISTKNPIKENSTPDSVREMLELSLKKLDVDYIDFYHLWGINWEAYQKTIDALMPAFHRMKDEGLIKHLSFSFHDKAENMVKIIDTGHFESVLCQYNMLDQANEESIAYAHEKGLGVAVMGPVGGGRLGAPSDIIRNMIPGGTKSSAELALRFVLSNENVSCAFSGMGSWEMVEENTEIASRPTTLTNQEKEQLLQAMEEKRKLAQLYCTGCGYCLPCPAGVDIPKNFEIMNLHRVYGVTEVAKKRYADLLKNTEDGKKAAVSCVECGQCEDKCPQKISIRKNLRETAETLGA